MRKFVKLIALMLVVVLGFSAVACKENISVSFKEGVPETVQVGTELKLRNYIEEDPEAVYILYASYEDPNSGEMITNKKQSSLTFTFDLATVYTLKVEMIKGKAKADASVTIEALPEAPNFVSVNKIRVPLGANKTFAEIAQSANILITPADLVDHIDFSAVEIKKATFLNSESQVPSLVSSRQIDETEIGFTFTDEGEYVFDISATNKSGTAISKLTVTNIDRDKSVAKVGYEYDPIYRNLTWQAIENATAYRLVIDGVAQTVTGTQFSFSEFEDGEYAMDIYPVFENVVYADAKVSGIITVGAVKTPLTLSTHNYTVSWLERPLAVSYKVTENGGEPVVIDSNTLSYTLTSTYDTHFEVPVTVVAEFEDGSTTEVSTIKVKYGTVTFGAWDLANTGTLNNSNDIKAYSDIDYVVVGTDLIDTFFMVEFTGKNVPNFAARAVKAYPTVTEEDLSEYKLWHDPGIFMFTSYLFGGVNAQKVYVNRGLCGLAPNVDGKGFLEPDTANGVGGSIATMRDNVKYIMIMGLEVVGGERNVSNVTCYLMSVEGTTVTKIYQMTLAAPSTSHALNGSSAIIYPALKNQKEEPITFTYYPAKATLASVVNESTSPYKDGIKAALGIN